MPVDRLDSVRGFNGAAASLRRKALCASFW